MFQWLRLQASTAGAEVQSLVWELRSCVPSCMLCCGAKKYIGGFGFVFECVIPVSL